MRRETRLVAVVFTIFIVSVAALRDWIHDDAEPPSAPPATFDEPPPEPEVAEPASPVDGAELVTVHRAFDRWRAPEDVSRAPGPDEKWIAVDVELRVPPESPFTFEDIAVLVDGRVEDREPIVRRLDADGAPADWDDPAFAGSDHYRVLLGYVVPGGARAVALGYGTARLTGPPIALGWAER